MVSVISDFNIICLGQKIAVKYEDNEMGIEYTETGNLEESFYSKEWNIISALTGIWYNIYPADGDKYNYERGFFDLQDGKSKVPNQKSDNLNEKGNFVFCANLSYNKLVEVIEFYIKLSPLKMICVMFGLDRDKGSIVGVMSQKEFFRRLNNGEINFDVIYAVSE